MTEELSPLGHLLRFYDEANNQLKDCEVYLPDDEGLMNTLPYTADWRQVHLKEVPLDLADRRVRETSENQKNYTESKQALTLRKDQETTIEKADLSKFILFDNLGMVFDHIKAESEEITKWNHFQFIKHWNRIDWEEKLKYYSAYTCHELNLFLAKKDSEFFEQVIRPFLTNKRQKTFLDLWLLNESLNDYKEQWKNRFPCQFEMTLLCKKDPELKKQFMASLQSQIKHADSDELWFDRAFNQPPDSLGKVQETFEEKEPEEKKMDLDLNSFIDDEDREKEHENRYPRASEDRIESGFKRKTGPDPFTVQDFLKHRKPDCLSRSQRVAKEWIEHGYYQETGTKKEKGRKPSKLFLRFLLDYLLHDEHGTFLSPYFMEDKAGFREGMFLLALLDIPFESEAPTLTKKGETLEIQTKGNALIFIKSVEESVPKETGEEKWFSVNQVYYQYHNHKQEERENPSNKLIRNNFQPGVVYGSRVIVSNRTFETQQAKLFYQIPQGAIPVFKTQEAGIFRMTLPGLSIETFDYYFYFPTPGNFSHAPAQVSLNEKVISQHGVFQFQVQQKKEVKTPQWEDIAQSGSDREILRYLKENEQTLESIDLTHLNTKLRHLPLYQKVVTLFRKQLAFNRQLFGYSLFHNDPENIAILLKQTEVATHSGLRFDSPLL